MLPLQMESERSNTSPPSKEPGSSDIVPPGMESESSKVISERSKMSMLLNVLLFTMCISIYSEGFTTSVEMRLNLTDLYAKNETVIFINTFQNRFCVGEIFHVSTFVSYYFIPADLTRLAVSADGVSIAAGSTVLVVLAAYLDSGLAYYATLLFSISVGVYGLIFTFGRLDDIKLADDAKTKPANKAKINPTINSDAASPMAVELVTRSMSETVAGVLPPNSDDDVLNRV